MSQDQDTHTTRTDQLTFQNPVTRYPAIEPPVQHQPEPGLGADLEPRAAPHGAVEQVRAADEARDEGGFLPFALANPTPEVHPDIAHKYASIVATGRSDYPNQINNVLAFPGVFRGLLDAHAEDVSIEMLIRAADAIAAVVKDEEINPSYIIPSVFHPDVADTVAVAIAGEGKTSAGATGPIKVGSRSTAAPVDETGTLPRVR